MALIFVGGVKVLEGLSDLQVVLVSSSDRQTAADGSRSWLQFPVEEDARNRTGWFQWWLEPLSVHREREKEREI